jgi:ribosomal protein S27AE
MIDTLADYLVDGYTANGYVYSRVAPVDLPPCPRSCDRGVQVVDLATDRYACTWCGLHYTAMPVQG